MAFPGSVHTVHLTRARGGRPKKHIAASQEDGLLQGPGGPVLDFGRDGGATLAREDSGWKWVWAAEPDGIERLETKDEAKLLYPATKLIDPIGPHESVMIQSAMRYLESKAIDLGEGNSRIPQPVLEELQSGSKSAHIDSIYSGRVLEVVHNPRAMIARSVLCFPTGQIGNLLNVSPFLPPSSATVYGRSISRFIPKSRPALRFPTEILQICSSPVTQTRLDRDATILAIRLHSYSYLIKLIPNPSYLDDPDDPASFAEIIDQLSCNDTGGRRHVDIALDPSTWCRALIVDDAGALWLWWEERTEKAEKITASYRSRQLRGPVGDGGEWYSVAFGTRPGNLIVASRKDITTFQIDDPESQNVLSLVGREITCLEKTTQIRGATYTVICTTREIMLVDDLNLDPPILSITHDYGSGEIKDLQVSVVQSEDHGDSTILSSRSHPLVMVFKLSLDPPARCLMDPSCLAIPLAQKDKPLHSLAYIRLSRWRQDRRTLCLLGLSADGALWEIPFADSTNDLRKYRSTTHGGKWAIKTPVDLKVEWDHTVKELSKQAVETVEAAWEGMGGDARLTSYREINARWAWLDINSDTQSSAIFSVSELEQYIRENEAPFTHFMLAGDLARDLYRDRKSRVRSATLRALPIVDRPGELNKLATLDFKRHLSVINSRQPETLAQLQERFPALSPHIDYRRRHRFDLLRLALDLSLSSTVLHTEDFTPLPVLEATQRTEEDDDADVARAAEQLTLRETEAEPIVFSILAPKVSGSTPDSMSDTMAGYAAEVLGTGPTLDDLQSPTARSILAEWSLGSDPRSYKWTPWRDNRQSSEASSSRPVRPLPSPRGQILVAPSTQPPALQPMASVPILRPAPPPISHTQAPRSSPDIGGFVQTQVERGPFGARPGGKKKVKKRVGGF